MKKQQYPPKSKWLNSTWLFRKEVKKEYKKLAGSCVNKQKGLGDQMEHTAFREESPFYALSMSYFHFSVRTEKKRSFRIAIIAFQGIVRLGVIKKRCSYTQICHHLKKDRRRNIGIKRWSQSEIGDKSMKSGRVIKLFFQVHGSGPFRTRKGTMKYVMLGEVNSYSTWTWEMMLSKI